MTTSIDSVALTLFWTSLFLMFYAYLGYPLSLILIGSFKKRIVQKEYIFPLVTLVITAYNEENTIGAKLKNTLNIDYPKGKLQIIVASDGSTDNTNRIVYDLSNMEVELLALRERMGKENAQKEAIKCSKGNIIVFTDAATSINRDGLKEIVANFSDPSIGCVSSEDRLIGRDEHEAGEGMYVKYEMWIRRLESRVNSIVGMSGSFFAARREVCMNIPGDLQSDFSTVLNSVRLRLRGVSDPNAIGYYRDIAEDRLEFDRKVRTVIRGLTVLFRHLEFLNLFKYGIFSYQIFCHKLLRWSVPLFLLITFVSNILLLNISVLYIVFFICQVLFYGISAWYIMSNSSAASRIIRIPTYFTSVNISILIAWWRYLKGQRVVMWTPTKR